MATSKGRLDKIAESLTPKQAVIAWIEEANQFESLSEYLLWLAERLKNPASLRTLTQRVEIGIRHRMQGEPAEKVQKTVRAAVRDTAFLDSLQLHVNGYFSSQWQRIDLCCKLLLERACGTLREAILAPLDLDRLDPDDTHEENLGSHAIEVFTLKAATEQLAEQYFDNHPILLKYFVEELHQSIKKIYQIRDTWQSVLYVEYRRYHPGEKGGLSDCRLDFDLEALKRSIDPTELVKSLVDSANIDTLANRNAALKLLVSMVDSQASTLRASMVS